MKRVLFLLVCVVMLSLVIVPAVAADMPELDATYAGDAWSNIITQAVPMIDDYVAANYANSVASSTSVAYFLRSPFVDDDDEPLLLLNQTLNDSYIIAVYPSSGNVLGNGVSCLSFRVYYNNGSFSNLSIDRSFTISGNYGVIYPKGKRRGFSATDSRKYGFDYYIYNLSTAYPANAASFTDTTPWILTTAEPVDTGTLEALIDEALQKEDAGYTVSSWTSFQAVLRTSQELLLVVHSQTDIDNQVILLQSAIDGLAELPPADELELLIVELQKLSSVSYTPESWRALQSILREAETLLSGRDYSAADLSSMMGRIQAAAGDLEEADASLIVMTPEMFDDVLEQVKNQIMQAFGVCVALFALCAVLPYLILKLRHFARPVS